jgi:hypothetical protein
MTIRSALLREECALMATVPASFTTLTATPSDRQRPLTGYHWTAPGWRCSLPPRS